MYNQPLTPSNYSDSEDESPQSNSTGQLPNYMRYPTPSAISGETSNDTADTDNSDSYVQFQNVQFTNFSLDHIAGMYAIRIAMLPCLYLKIRLKSQIHNSK